MSYEPPPPTWLSGEQILAHICAADACTVAEARANLELAIRHKALPIRPWPPSLDVGHPLSSYLPTGPGRSPATTPDWKGLLLPAAQVREDGKIKFGSKTWWQNFEAKREDVERRWPTGPKSIKQKIADELREPNTSEPSPPDAAANVVNIEAEKEKRGPGRPPKMAQSPDGPVAIRDEIKTEAERYVNDPNSDLGVLASEKKLATYLLQWAKNKFPTAAILAHSTIMDLARPFSQKRPKEQPVKFE
jgi:hypothetical protein